MITVIGKNEMTTFSLDEKDQNDQMKILFEWSNDNEYYWGEKNKKGEFKRKLGGYYGQIFDARFIYDD